MRSQIDYYNFILKLLKEEHKNLSSKSLLIPIKTSENDEPKLEQETGTATDFMQLKMQSVNSQVELAFKKSKQKYTLLIASCVELIDMVTKKRQNQAAFNRPSQ